MGIWLIVLLCLLLLAHWLQNKTPKGPQRNRPTARERMEAEERGCRAQLESLQSEYDLPELALTETKDSTSEGIPFWIFRYALSHEASGRRLTFKICRDFRSFLFYAKVRATGFSGRTVFEIDLGHGDIEGEMRKVVAEVRESVRPV